ncbi:MAG: hypothetical protein ABIG43_00990 [Chloroflexota bacterium]
MDKIWIIGIAGIVLALLMMAIFFGKNKTDATDSQGKLKTKIGYENDYTRVLYDHCPYCHALLRQRVTLKAPQTLDEVITSSAFLSEELKCPQCHQTLHMEEHSPQ